MPIGSSWGYVEGMTYCRVREIVHGLIDRTSRNGGLILSLSPKADGTLPDEQKKILSRLGTWLEVNGEAIFGTRPWRVHAQGPETKFLAPPNALDHRHWVYSGGDAGDVRFTCRGENVYVILLGWPEDQAITIASLTQGRDTVTSVSLLGHDGPLT
jgi:alpha-L-fucosidase